MEVLVTGDTRYLSRSFVAAAFPEASVVVTRPVRGVCVDERLHTVDVADDPRHDELGKTYEFDCVVYLSEALSPHDVYDGLLERLRRTLQRCADHDVRMLYVSGPLVAFAANGSSSVAPDALLARAAEDLCRYYAEECGAQIKVLHAPYLYTAPQDDPCGKSGRVFDIVEDGVLALHERADDPLYALRADDLAELVRRMFDSWTPDFETFTVPEAFGATMADFGDAAAALVEGLQVRYGTGEPLAVPPDDGVLRERFGWSPRHRLIDDLPALYRAWEAAQGRRPSALARLLRELRSAKPLVIAVEIALAFAAAEAVTYCGDSIAGLAAIDARLLFVVVIATAHGLNAGLAAGALASAGLVVQDVAAGSATAASLFYDPSNWLPFIAYFMVGAVCGYTRLRHIETLEFERARNALLRDRLAFVEGLYRDALERKHAFRKQILGRRDSFGKIYAVTRELDSVKPQDLYRKTIAVLEEVLENSTISIYHVVGGGFARLAAACPDNPAAPPRSLRMEDLSAMTQAMRAQGGVWANRELEPDRPMFAYGALRAGRPVVLIFVQDAAPDQMSLYYQNLFRVLCGLVETALMRAFDYEDAVREARCVPGTRVLAPGPFREELRSALSLQQDRMARHLVLRVDASSDASRGSDGPRGLAAAGEQAGPAALRGSDASALFERAVDAVRESDFAGVDEAGALYLLLNQAGEDELPIVERRLAARGIRALPLSIDEERALARERDGEDTADACGKDAVRTGARAHAGDAAVRGTRSGEDAADAADGSAERAAFPGRAEGRRP